MNKKTVISMVVLTMMSALPTWAWKGDIVVSTPKPHWFSMPTKVVRCVSPILARS